MPTLKQIIFASVFVCALLSTAAAQKSSSATVQRSSLTITANASGDRVRVTAPSSVVQIHLEVYAATGEKVFDEELRGANVFDWHLQNGQAQRLSAGDYVCVVTAKTISGKLTQKIGTVTVAENSAGLRAGDSQEFTPPQAQAIGPVEADSSWTVVAEGENQTTTVIANDGTDGLMIRGRGALSFRLGDFYSGKDEEQMRLTEDGNLGIGTNTPQSKLDVAGTIRAERFLVVKPSTPGSKAQTSGATQTTDSAGSVQPLVAGTGTENQIAKWTETGGAGTLGDSGITETVTGKVGVGIASPLSKLHVSSNFDALRMTSTNDTTPTWAQFNTSAGTGLGYFGVEGSTPGTFLTGTLPYATAISSGSSGTALQLGSAGSVKMTILNDGNVGIGTTNPQAKLEVVGSLAKLPNGVQLAAGAQGNNVAFGSPNSETGMTISGSVGRADLRYNGSTLKLVTGPANSGPPAATNGISINQAGNVGIGLDAANQSARLEVRTVGRIGVSALSDTLTALLGNSTSGIGAYGASQSNFGVIGYSSSSAGIAARSTSGVLVAGYPSQFDSVRIFHIDLNGTYVAGSDFAESLPTRGEKSTYEPGDVLIMSTQAAGAVEKSARPYDARVMGVYSTRPAMLGADKDGATRIDPGEVPVAIVGIVPTKVSAENGPVQVGDLLTTSGTPGYAMKASHILMRGVKVYRTGTILGKALEPLKNGKGVIKVLVTLR